MSFVSYLLISSKKQTFLQVYYNFNLIITHHVFANCIETQIKLASGFCVVFAHSIDQSS